MRFPRLVSHYWGAGLLLALRFFVHSVGGLMLIKSGVLLMTQHIAQSLEATN